MSGEAVSDDAQRVSAAPDPYRAAFETAPVGLVALSPDGALVRDANPFLCRLLGHPPGALTGRPVADLAGDRATALAPGVVRWRRADGKGIDVRVSLSSGEAGPVAVVAAVDADEFVRADQNRDTLAAAGLGEWRWEATARRVFLSRRAGQILGFPSGRPLSWADLRARIEPEDMARIGLAVAAAIKSGRPYAFESRFRRDPDDRSVWITVRGQAVCAGDGSVSAMVGTVQDISTRVEARTALREREQRLRVATTLAALGIFEWHLLDDQATWENERMYEIFGRTPAEGTLGKSEFLSEILHPEDRKAFRLAISRALREDRILHASGRIRRAHDGAWRTIEMAGRFERDAPDRLPRRLIGVVADVTDRRHAEERQSLLIRELHHRVKNTLATVQAIVGSTARTASSIESFYEAFVGRIMSLSHTHSVLTEDTWQTADLRTLLVNELKPYAEGTLDGEGDGRIHLVGPAVDLPSDLAVPIGMAIHELTTNAAKYGALTTRGGRVEVVWDLEPGGEAGILHFAWREQGGPLVRPPTRLGFGSRLLQRVLSTQVQAEVATDYPAEGFRLTMRAPLPRRVATLGPTP